MSELSLIAEFSVVKPFENSSLLAEKSCNPFCKFSLFWLKRLVLFEISVALRASLLLASAIFWFTEFNFSAPFFSFITPEFAEFKPLPKLPIPFEICSEPFAAFEKPF